MFSLLYNCAHFTYFQVYDQISFKLGFSNMWTENFQMYKLGFKETEEAEIKLPTFIGSWSKQDNFRKTSIFVSFTTLRPLTVWITTNCEKFLKRWEYHTALPVSWESCMQVKKHQLKTNMEQWTVSKLGKSYNKTIYCHPVCLTSMQITSWEMLVWMSHKLESRLPEEISTTSDLQMILL